MGKLTVKQQRFVEEYLVDFNATQAAIRAGYSKKTAKEQGYRLFTNVHIEEEISQRLKQLTTKTQLTQERVLAEYIKLAFVNIKDVMSWNDSAVEFKCSDDIPDDVAACIAEVRQTFSNHGANISLKMHDKKGALDMLGKYLQMFTDKVEVTGANGAPLISGIDAPRSETREEWLQRVKKEAASNGVNGSNGHHA